MESNVCRSAYTNSEDIFPFYSVIYFHSQVNLQEEGDEIDFRHLNGGDVSWHSIIFQRYMSTLNNYCHVTKILTQPVVTSKALHMYILDEISVLRSAKANAHSVRRLNNEAIVQLENVRGHLLCWTQHGLVILYMHHLVANVFIF